MFVEGIRLAEDASRSSVRIQECFVSSKAFKNERVKNLAARLINSGINVN
jgi:tRNA G18 (ribose-2'-O)-methylase SpoU